MGFQPLKISQYEGGRFELTFAKNTARFDETFNFLEYSHRGEEAARKRPSKARYKLSLTSLGNFRAPIRSIALREGSSKENRVKLESH